jgi:predicted permease
MTALWQDIRYSLRMLRKSPGFTAIALITLAIGIGANTIMFSIADMLLLRPLGVKEPEQLACCGISDFHIHYSTYLAIRKNNNVFSDLMVQDEGLSRVTLTRRDTTRQVNAMFVSGNYFSFLGAVPVYGRGFLPDEDRQDISPVVVLSYQAWQRQGADPTIVGQYLRINGVPCQVVGVAQKGFSGISLAGPDLWLPIGSYLRTMVLSRGESMPPEKWRDLSSYPFYLIPVGRLKPGLSMSSAQASLQAMVPILKEKYPRHWKSRSKPYLYPVPRVSIVFGDKEHPIMTGVSLFLMGLSAIILIIACFNLANMLIIRGSRRCREIAVRLALGGGRLRIIRQLLIESLLLALLGGALGLLLAFCGTGIINAWIATSQRPGWRCLQTNLSIRVLGMTLCISFIAAVLFGLRPALGLSRRDIVSELKESGSTMLLPIRHRRGGLSVLCQTASAVVLVMIAVMFTHYALQVARPNRHLNLDDTLVVELDPLSAGYDRLRSAQACEALADHLESLPGMDSVGASPSFSFGDVGVYSIYQYNTAVESDNSEKFLASHAARLNVGQDYFSSVGLPLLQGRTFNRLDSVTDAENVVIIDKAIAHKLDPNGNALGSLIRYGTFSDRSEPYRIVGVVLGIPGTQGKPTFPQTYTPVKHDQICACFYLHLKNPGSAVAMKQRILEAIHKFDPYMPVLSVATLAYRHRDYNILWFSGICARLTGLAGATALFLAALGIYAVKGYMIASRTREIGIRKALGATHRNIMGIVFKEGFILTAAGLFVGLLLGWGATHAVASVLYGVNTIDIPGVVVTIALLGIASSLAGYLPARRAAKIDPMEALRYE